MNNLLSDTAARDARRISLVLGSALLLVIIVAVVTIQDSGSGISLDDQQELFRPFTRLSSAGTERGAGLGLSLVKTVVERHGGRVTVYSALGQGTIFGIHVPADRPL